ncbi:endonuclease domain-containing protein [Roseibium sp.]|uniref:endonuclease domain-containing protein n=1 Tax=Roseibium sp. TaxID=1936156 RepID=UPI003A981A03
MSASADRGGEHGIIPKYRQPRHLRTNAKRLRKDMTEAERQLWNAIRAHRLDGIGFRRQMPIAKYIVDFASPEYRLIVELDGSQHGKTPGRLADRERDLMLSHLGWKVLRFWNVDVMADLDGVCRKIMNACGREIRA